MTPLDLRQGCHRLRAGACAVFPCRPKTMRPSLRILPLAIACLPLAATAAEPPLGIEPEWNARLRHEHVDDDAFARGAQATTLRLRAGLRLRLGEHFSALMEGEGIASAGDSYNSGANGQATLPVIADPEGAELNQAWLSWKNDRFEATGGR